MKLKNRVHECLAAGRPAYGACCILNSPLAAEMMACMDFDFIVVDMQHSATGPADSGHLIRAVQAANPDVAPFARIPTQDKYWIEQCLDAGYLGLIVPFVESADQASALVRAAFYPPKGGRSQAGTIRAHLYEGYFSKISERLILLPQIESKTGLERCEEIAAVPGVSGLLMGPGDLSLSCGWSGKDLWTFPPFKDAVRRVQAACAAAGKVSATLVGGAEAAAHARDAGYRVIGFASDGADMRAGWAPTMKQALKALRSIQESR